MDEQVSRPGQAGSSGEEAGPLAEEVSPKKASLKWFLTVLLAAAGVAGGLAFVLLLAFTAAGLAGALYWAVAVAVVGGVVMRRQLFEGAGRVQTILFMGATLAGAIGGLRLARLLLLSFPWAG